MRQSALYRYARVIGLTALVSVLAGAPPAGARDQASPAAGPTRFDEPGVRAAVMQRVEGQRTRNAILSASVFADDAVWINAFGIRVVGRAAIQEFLAGLYADPGFVQAQFVPPQIEEIVFLRPDVAVARTFSRIQGQRLSDGTMIAERRTHNTMTLTHEPAGWRVCYEVVTDERSRSR
jgi:uncharacterized protein (TIGR02246 family)